MAGRMLPFSVGLVIIGFAGGYGLRDGWMSFTFYHLGGIGATSLLACIAGSIAAKKGHGYWRAFTLALSLPILLGVIAAYLVTPETDGGRPAACGGSVSLVVGLIFIAAWAFVKRKQVRTA